MNANVVKNEISFHVLTETNLMTIQNIFKLVIMQNYEEETINEVENLMNFYYDKVTEQEKRNNKKRLTQNYNKVIFFSHLNALLYTTCFTDCPSG